MLVGAMDIEFFSESAWETMDFGRRIGERLRGGEVFAIEGPLGSGKTHLIKGVAAGAGAEDRLHVNSPTFVLVNEYEGRLHLYHIDAYRLESVREFEDLGFDDFCDPGSVVMVEWADKVLAAFEGVECVEVKMSHEGQNKRLIKMKNVPEYLKVV